MSLGLFQDFGNYLILQTKHKNESIKLEEKEKTQVEILLKQFGCWDPLWKDKNLSLMDYQEERFPFRSDRKMLGVNE